MKAVRLVIDGRPRTKKTSQAIGKNKKTGASFIFNPSEIREWTEDARFQARTQYRGKPIEGPVIVNYQIYRWADMGDLGGFEAAIDDMLQGVVYKNDKQIMGRATAKHIDRENPRVEILVSAVAA